MRLILLLSVVALLDAPASQAQPVPRLPWALRRDIVGPLTVPAAIRNRREYKSMISDLEYYKATDTVKGVPVDLNGDGAMDYLIQSAPSLCGNAGCGYAVFDGATHKSLGEVGLGTLYVLSDMVRGYPIVVAWTRLGWDTGEYTTYAFSGSAYVEVSRREVRSGTRDSLDSALDRIPWWRPPPGR